MFTSRDFSAFVVLSFSFCLFTRNCAIVLNLEGEASWACCCLNFAISYSCHFFFFLRNSFSVLRKFRPIFNLAKVQFLLFAPFLWRPKYSQTKRFHLRGDSRFRGKTDLVSHFHDCIGFGLLTARKGDFIEKNEIKMKWNEIK